MTAIHEFADPIPVDTPFGEGLALFVEVTGHDYYWTIALNVDGALVTLRQAEIKMHRNFTLGVGMDHAAMSGILAASKAK